MNTENETTTFNHAGFVTANPIKGRIYLAWNNCATNFYCPGCGIRDRALWPVSFFYEGDSGQPVCAECARKDGFTIGPEALDELLHYLYVGVTSAPGSYQTAAEREAGRILTVPPIWSDGRLC